MDISQYIFAPWQRQAELQQTQAATAMQQMQMAAYPEQQRRSAELQQAQIEHYKAQSEEQRALALQKQTAALQTINDELAARGQPTITLSQLASGQIPQTSPFGTTKPMSTQQIPNQMQGAPNTPQQLVGGMGGGQAPVINAQGQYSSQPAMDAISNNMALSVQRLNNLTSAGRVSGPLYEKTLKDVQDAGKTYADIAQKDASRMESVTRSAKTNLDYVTQLAQVVKTPKDFESAMRMADVSGVQWPLPRTYPEAKSFIDRLATDSKQAVDIAAEKQLQAQRRASTAKEITEQQIKKIELDRERVIDAEAKRQSDAVTKAGGAGVVTAEQVKAEAKARGTQAGGGGAGRSTALLQSRAYTMYNAGENAHASIMNLANAPAGTQLSATAGLAGKSGEGLVEAITSTFARKMTPIEQRALQMDITGAIRQMLRFQSGGFATGVTESAIKEFNQQLVRAGDDDEKGILSAMMLARLTQEYSVESKAFKNNPGASQAQAESIAKNADELKKTFPMSVNDVWNVINKIKDPKKRQTISDQNKALLKTFDSDVESSKTTATNYPSVGDVRGGFRFKGGDPSKKENWEKM